MDPVQGAQSPVWGQDGGQGPGRMRQVLDSVSSLLGVDSSQIIDGLRSGQSLADIAAQNGVSRDQLIATVTQALSSNTQGASTDAAAASQGIDPSTLAQQIVDRKGFGGHHHHHHHGMSDQTDTASGVNDEFEQAFSELSSALGLSESDLAKALQAGTSLFDLAAQHGVSQDAITDAMTNAIGQGSLLDTSA